ncbi:MAG: hypothetical protein KAR79_02915 [Simkaniaceae bacterium]|nr:hypothetical protein [Simkaniaceae bacterium]
MAAVSDYLASSSFDPYIEQDEGVTLYGRINNAWKACVNGMICISGFSFMAVACVAMSAYHVALATYLVAEAILFGTEREINYYPLIANNIRNLADAIEENFVDRERELILP